MTAITAPDPYTNIFPTLEKIEKKISLQERIDKVVIDLFFFTIKSQNYRYQYRIKSDYSDSSPSKDVFTKIDELCKIEETKSSGDLEYFINFDIRTTQKNTTAALEPILKNYTETFSSLLFPSELELLNLL